MFLSAFKRHRWRLLITLSIDYLCITAHYSSAFRLADASAGFHDIGCRFITPRFQFHDFVAITIEGVIFTRHLRFSLISAALRPLPFQPIQAAMHFASLICFRCRFHWR